MSTVPPSLDPAKRNARTRNRWMLIGIAALFFGPILLALALNLAGWRPASSKAYGTLIDPPRDVSATPVSLASGDKLMWRNPQWQWTLVALAGSSCEQHCRAQLADVVRMRATLGRNAERLRVIYFGPALPAELLAASLPLQPGNDDAAAFTALRPQADDALALALVDPGGYLMLSYPEGYDVAGVRRDLPKVIN